MTILGPEAPRLPLSLDLMPGPTDLARRRALLTTALVAALLDTQGQPEPPEQTRYRDGDPFSSRFRKARRESARQS